MKEIGAILRAAREEKGLSLQEVSDITRVTVSRLHAIEEGNMDYFKDDISYVRYYIRFYANALDIDYETIREPLKNALNDFEETQKIQITTEHKIIESNVKTTAGKYSKEKKVDISQMLLIAGIVSLSMILLFTFITYILPSFNKDKPIIDPDPIVDPLPNNPEDEDIVKPDPVVKKIQVDKIGEKEYVISNFDENPISFKIHIGNSDTWVNLKINNEKISNPASTIYKPNDVVEWMYTPNMEDILTIQIGRVHSNHITINDELLEIDSKFIDSDKGLTLLFSFKGE